MQDDIRKRLRSSVGMALALLPRYVRHDFWRISEPAHGRAHDAITEAILTRLDSEFEVAVKERPAEATYTGTRHHTEAKGIRER